MEGLANCVFVLFSEEGTRQGTLVCHSFPQLLHTGLFLLRLTGSLAVFLVQSSVAGNEFSFDNLIEFDQLPLQSVILQLT